jgi:hypothetical protein
MYYANKINYLLHKKEAALLRQPLCCFNSHQDEDLIDEVKQQSLALRHEKRRA